jgi:hypothetical protein
LSLSHALEGMPLRFVNNRTKCNVVYKLCEFDDIDVPRPPAVTRSTFLHGPVRDARRASFRHSVKTKQRPYYVLPHTGALPFPLFSFIFNCLSVFTSFVLS